MLTCEECKVAAAGAASYWVAMLVEDPDGDEPTTVAGYCPRCAEHHFGYFTHKQRVTARRRRIAAFVERHGEN